MKLVIKFAGALLESDSVVRENLPRKSLSLPIKATRFSSSTAVAASSPPPSNV